MKGFDHHHKSNYINVIIRSLYEEVKSRRVFSVTAGNDQFVLSFSSKWYFQSKIKVIMFYAGWQYIVLYLDAGLSTGGIDVIWYLSYINAFAPSSVPAHCGVYLLSFAVIPGSALSSMALIRDQAKTLWLTGTPRLRGGSVDQALCVSHKSTLEFRFLGFSAAFTNICICVTKSFA